MESDIGELIREARRIAKERCLTMLIYLLSLAFIMIGFTKNHQRSRQLRLADRRSVPCGGINGAGAASASEILFQTLKRPTWAYSGS